MSAIDEHLPVLREFVDAVRDRDADVIWACLQYTPPGTLAQIAAEWISQLLAEADDAQVEIARLRAVERAIPGGDLVTAYRIVQQRRAQAEAEVKKLRAANQELRDIINARTAAAPKRRKDAA